MNEITYSPEDTLILLVDDIPKNLQLLGKLLSSKGYRIAAVSEGDQVVSSAKKYEPDLILLDVMMPGKNGFEVCEELKDDPELKQIPIIFLTAKVEQDNIVRGLELGGADYITKPFNSKELIARVETHISLKRSRDQIEQKNHELIQLNATKDKIYSVIGHDLKTPVNTITGFSELILEDLNNENIVKAVEKAEYIHLSSRNMSTLLQDLLSWARLQSGDLRLNLSNFSIVDIITKAIELLRATAEKKEITMVFNFDEKPAIHADKQLIQTIVRNFLSNAIKFSYEKGTININLEQNNGYWHISVTDQGRGMSKEEQDKLFQKGIHPTKSGTANEKGTGLGLLLSNQLAEMHGGSIEVESQLDEGSTFTLVLPAETENQVEIPRMTG